METGMNRALRKGSFPVFDNIRELVDIRDLQGNYVQNYFVNLFFYKFDQFLILQGFVVAIIYNWLNYLFLFGCN